MGVYNAFDLRTYDQISAVNSMRICKKSRICLCQNVPIRSVSHVMTPMILLIVVAWVSFHSWLISSEARANHD